MFLKLKNEFRNINIGNLKAEVLDTSVSLHANKDTVGQYQTHFKILQNKVRNLEDHIKSLKHDLKEPYENPIQQKPKISKSSWPKPSTKRTFNIWNSITKYHKYQPFPFEHQQFNEIRKGFQQSISNTCSWVSLRPGLPQQLYQPRFLCWKSWKSRETIFHLPSGELFVSTWSSQI